MTIHLGLSAQVALLLLQPRVLCWRTPRNVQSGHNSKNPGRSSHLPVRLTTFFRFVLSSLKFEFSAEFDSAAAFGFFLSVRSRQVGLLT